MSTKTKKCPLCGAIKVVKRGIQNGLQTYWCRSCGKRFRSERKKKDNIAKDIFNNLDESIEKVKKNRGKIFREKVKWKIWVIMSKLKIVKEI